MFLPQHHRRHYIHCWVLDKRKHHRSVQRISHNLFNLNFSKIIAFLFILAISCENPIEKVKTVNIGDDSPVESSRNVELIYSDSAIVKFKLTAPRLDRFIDNDTTWTEFPEGIKVVFYNSKRDVESQINAKYAIHYEKAQKLEARNDVIVINSNGEMLNTEHLWWEQTTNKIYSDDFVKITTEDEIIYGDGLEANENFTKYKILNIKGTIAVEDSAFVD